MRTLSAEINFTFELRRHDLFAGLEEGQLHRILSSCYVYALNPGEHLFEQGQPSDRFFLLRRGLLKLSRLSLSGEEKVVELVKTGQTFAEALMFMGGERSYPVTACAIEQSDVLGFDNRTFMELLKGSPDTCLRLLASMSKRMHALIAEIDRLALQSATSRLVDFLLSSAEGDKVELRTPKHVLASCLSIKPETLSRILARLSADGMILVSGAHIELVCPDELKCLVESLE